MKAGKKIEVHDITIKLRETKKGEKNVKSSINQIPIQL